VREIGAESGGAPRVLVSLGSVVPGLKRDIMSETTPLSVSVSVELSRFLTSNGIESIEINRNVNFNNNREISDVILHNAHEVQGRKTSYRVSFKLQEAGADSYRLFSAMSAQPLAITFTESALQLPPEELERRVLEFLALIKTRAEKAKQEQEVQSIQFVGNTFILNRSTTFKVLADDGAGRLDIEIINGDGLQEAMLSAHGLLDGLYTGFIELVE